MKTIRVELLYYSKNNSSLRILSENNINEQIPISPNDILYIYTDGIFDQLGGNEEKRLKRKNWREFLSNLIGKPMYTHQEEILRFFNTWKNNEPQTDDITIFGIQI